MLGNRKRYVRKVGSRDEDRVHRPLHQSELTVRAEPIAFQDLFGQRQKKSIVERSVSVCHHWLRRSQPKFQRHGQQHQKQ
jgi:hypothetical protein